MITGARTVRPAGLPGKARVSSSVMVPDAATGPASGQYAGRRAVLISPAAPLTAAVPVLVPALPERPVMPSSQFPGGSPGWMPRGACQGEDPERFLPVTAAGPALAQVLAAKAVDL
jgi:hypothetical protein